MRIVFIGPPGAGKGTQSLRIAEHLNLPYLSTGEVLRQAREEGTEIGLRAAEYLDAGKLVPDDLVVQLVAGRLCTGECRVGYLFDGFPRTQAQAEALDKLLLTDCSGKLDAAVEFAIPEDVLLERLSKRGRTDDSEETIRQRLRLYAELTEPLASYYAKRGILKRIDAVGTPDEVFARLVTALDELKP
jgi:adenylate kinase